MEKSFCFGLLIGMIGGALIAVNSQKARAFVKKSQDDVVEKMTEYIDGKLDEKQKNVTAADKSAEEKPSKKTGK